jgi:sarcosine oxidase subunit beta
MKSTSDIIICGAGIAGVSAAYHLAVKQGLKNILLLDERPPLSLTSDKSTECYRNWWPGPGGAMVALMNHSIDLLEKLAEESGNVFQLNRRGYLYLTADPHRIPEMQAAAQEPPQLGAGPLRVHPNQSGHSNYLPALEGEPAKQLDGADLILDTGLIQQYFPYLSERVVAALHVRKAGWLSAQQLGMYLLEQARLHGVTYVNSKVTRVNTTSSRVQGIQLNDGSQINTGTFVNAAGPLLKDVGEMLGLELPVFNELHMKVALRDTRGVIPRYAPLLIWTDPQKLPWSPDERQILSEDPETRWLLDEFPSGVHTRPEGGTGSQVILMLWEYHTAIVEPTWPPPLDHQYPEIALRGLAAMLPGLTAYFGNAPRPVLDGGYYTKTQENRPLIGPLPVEGAYVIGALSGYGIMSSCAAGDLLAAHVAGSSLPSYAPAFTLDRYQDPAYQKLLMNWGSTGQL